MAERGAPFAGQGGIGGGTPGGTRRTLLKALALLLALPALAALPAQEPAEPGGDFSAVTTRAAARKLVREGRLVEITLFPAELGGPDDPENRAFVTPEAAAARSIAIGTLGRFIEEGVIDRLEIVPDYKGDSLIPSYIAMTGLHSGRPGSITVHIPVW